MAVNDLYRIVVNSKDAANNRFQNVFTVKQTVGTDLNAVDLQDFYADWTGVANGLLPTTCLFTDATLHKLDNLGRWQPVCKFADPVQGEDVADPLPYQAAGVLVGYTGVAKTLGKKWIGPLTEAVQSAGVLTAGAQTILGTLATMLQTGYTSSRNNEWDFGTWTASKGFHAFVSCLVNTIIGSQRRRKPGVGM